MMSQVRAKTSARDVLMLMQLLVIVPMVTHLPTWIIVMGVVVAITQLSVLKHRLHLYGRFELVVQLILFFGGLLGVFFAFRTFLGVEAGVSFLMLCLIAKLLEVKARRDVYIVLTLALFVVSSGFLFSQSLVASVLALLGLLAILYAMIAQNDDGQGRIRSLFWITVQAVPLMVILFLFFPRFPPLWSVQIGAGQGQTGMSEEMSPGDIASLSQSAALAFRVFFEGQPPAKSDLYWRGLVLSQFDGRTWMPLPAQQTGHLTAWVGQRLPSWIDQSLVVVEQQPRSYRMVMEPTQREWLFPLSLPYATQQQPSVGLTREYTLKAASPIRRQQHLQFLQFQDVTLDADLPDWLRRANLALPPQSNPLAQKFAQDLFQRMNANPERYAESILAWIRQQNFVYTLQPPLLSGHRVDQFLFETRRGFCEHYASAFVFLMRAAGVPARVVAGYQGGALGRDGESWEVRQRDAHAWTEIWLAGQGWVRIDPTAAIAPHRIEQGMSAVTDDVRVFGEGAGAMFRQSQFQLLSQAREWADYAGYLWQRDVVGFDQDRQANKLKDWFNLRSM
ncbi:MAG: DUF3488 and transglutaminase-like domain-containing protein, partial [Pseudomonadota bacterium]|nr:DUF3488 and transglutaminase-like domain-containing protein [Pseudomonadota bacterium]